MHALSLLTLFLPLVKANLHNQCYCMTWRPHTDWIHNTMLTEYICTQQYPGAAQFDTVTGRCVVKAGWVFDGQTWEDQCKDGAFQGYFPIKNGKPDHSINPITDTLAVGSCPDRN